ncbi:MAG: hypothetical protein ACP5QU_02570 [Anaerolineae bacterium]
MSNKTLFSQHFLDLRLPDLPEWSDAPLPVLEQMRVLYAKARQFGSTWNKAQTEEKFVKPVLRLPGWEFLVQPKSQRGGGVTQATFFLVMAGDRHYGLTDEKVQVVEGR